MKELVSSFIIAFSMYSKIPMPKMDWKEENMKYVMCFFPLVGIIIGGVVWIAFCLSPMIPMSRTFKTVIFVLLPLALSGGIHLDGMLDTVDALSSFQSKERKLEILKDPHMGAFAVMVAIAYFLLAYGIWYDITSEAMGVIALSFVLSRTLSGLSIVSFQLAKTSGLAATFSNSAKIKITRIAMLGYLFFILIALLYLNLLLGMVAVLTAALVYAYYYYIAMKNFGGITGDLAGFFLQICEISIAATVVIASKFS